MTQQRKELSEAERLAIIANAVRVVQGEIPQGLANHTAEDVEDEAQHLNALDHEEKVDFDNDENEVDMENVSLEMRKAFA